MKIEKVNDNQIRCTLTREDLASRQLKISELAYGTEKAKSLFRDMMQQANYEFGFEAEDIPLMIEAIPLNAECIVLIITKVEDPEELDTRFSRFAPAKDDDDEEYDEIVNEQPDSSDDVMELFRKLQENRKSSSESSRKHTKEEPAGSSAPTDRIFRMDSIQAVMSAAIATGAYYYGESSLYKEERTGQYLLVLSQGKMSTEDFNRISNILSEYGSLCKTPTAGQSYLEEHYAALIAANALQSLSCTITHE